MVSQLRANGFSTKINQECNVGTALNFGLFFTFLESAQNSASSDTLHGQFRRIFFSTLIRGGASFFEG
jgi:hypothetical protein